MMSMRSFVSRLGLTHVFTVYTTLADDCSSKVLHAGGMSLRLRFVEYARIAREQHDVQAESHGLHMSNRARNLIAAGHVSGDSFCSGAASHQSDGVGSRNMHGSCTSEVKHGNDLHSDGNNTDDDEYLDEWEEG